MVDRAISAASETSGEYFEPGDLVFWPAALGR
jgi:hypothetical protein